MLFRSANQPAEPLAGDGRSRPSEAPGHLEIADLEMLKGLAGIRTHATRVRIPVLANDQDLERLSDRAAPLLPQAPMGLLIAGHGLYAWGKDLPEARRHVEILEFLLEQRWRQLLLAALPATQDGVTGAARLGEPAAEGPGA